MLGCAAVIGVFDTRDGAPGGDGQSYDVIIVRGTDGIEELRAHLKPDGFFVVHRDELDHLNREVTYLRAHSAQQTEGIVWLRTELALARTSRLGRARESRAARGGAAAPHRKGWYDRR